LNLKRQREIKSKMEYKTKISKKNECFRSSR
jgi:hypothetical protein